MSTLTKPVNPLLAAYTQQLIARPQLTRSVTSAVLAFLQETLASRLAGVPAPAIKATGIPPIDAVKRNARAFKLAAYGALLSAPISQALVERLQRQFAGRTDTRAKVLQILAQNFVVAPILLVLYLSSASVIDGSRSINTTVAYIKRAFFFVFKQTLLVNPIAVFVAQKALSPELWMPWFTFVNFCLATKINYDLKVKQVAAKSGAE